MVRKPARHDPLGIRRESCDLHDRQVELFQDENRLHDPLILKCCLESLTGLTRSPHRPNTPGLFNLMSSISSESPSRLLPEDEASSLSFALETSRAYAFSAELIETILSLDVSTVQAVARRTLNKVW